MTTKAYLTTMLYVSITIMAVASLIIGLNGVGEGSIRWLIKWTAQMATVLFVCAFTASSIQYFIKGKWGFVLLSNRPHVGLAFGTFHTFHLFALIWLQQTAHPVFTNAMVISLLAGGTAYFLMYLMMLTTFPSIKGKMDPKYWRWLHLVGSLWIWAIFVRTYFKSVFYQDQRYLLFGLLIIAMILRLAYWYKSKRQAAMAS